MTEGYSMNGSQAKSVALNPGGSLSGGKRFSVRGPVWGPSPPPPANAATRTRGPSASNQRRGVTAGVSGVRGGQAGGPGTGATAGPCYRGRPGTDIDFSTPPGTPHDRPDGQGAQNVGPGSGPCRKSVTAARLAPSNW